MSGFGGKPNSRRILFKDGVFLTRTGPFVLAEANSDLLNDNAGERATEFSCCGCPTLPPSGPPEEA